MVIFNRLRNRGESSPAEAQKTGWEKVEAMGRQQPQRQQFNTTPSPMSPDVARMQDSLRKMQEIQAAREQAIRAAGQGLDNINRKFGIK